MADRGWQIRMADRGWQIGDKIGDGQIIKPWGQQNRFELNLMLMSKSHAAVKLPNN